MRRSGFGGDLAVMAADPRRISRFPLKPAHFCPTSGRLARSEMSDPTPPDSNRSLPEGVPAPPPPRPDLRDHRQDGPTYGEKRPGRKAKRKARERKHPTDAYEPLRPARSIKGCFLGLAALCLLLLLGAGIAGWLGPGRFAARDYRIVNLKPGSAVVRIAPEEPTLFLARGKLVYAVPQTRVPVAFLAREVSLEGDFHEEVSITTAKIALGAEARFAKDLEIYALEFRDQGITLKGTLKGRVVLNSPSP